MRRSALLASVILAALALSAGALAYPALVGPRSSSTGALTGPAAEPPAAPADGRPENVTAPRLPVHLNETEDEARGPAVVEHNVTVTRTNETIWVNGTLVISVGNATVVNLTFSIEVRPGEGANVTFNGTIETEDVEVHVSGLAAILPRERTVTVQGVLVVLRDGDIVRSRDFSFQMIWPDVDEARLLADPLPGLSFDLRLDSV